jgi:hypothetical protein
LESKNQNCSTNCLTTARNKCRFDLYCLLCLPRAGRVPPRAAPLESGWRTLPISRLSCGPNPISSPPLRLGRPRGALFISAPGLQALAARFEISYPMHLAGGLDDSDGPIVIVGVVAFGVASVTPCKRAARMDERFDLYRGGECVMRGASLRDAAEVLNIEMFEVAMTMLEYGRCVVGEFSAVPSEDRPSST